GTSLFRAPEMLGRSADPIVLRVADHVEVPAMLGIIALAYICLYTSLRGYYGIPPRPRRTSRCTASASRKRRPCSRTSVRSPARTRTALAKSAFVTLGL